MKQDKTGELVLAQNRLQKMMHNSPLAIGIFDMDGALIEQNEPFTKLWQNIAGPGASHITLTSLHSPSRPGLAFYFLKAKEADLPREPELESHRSNL